MAQLAYEPGLYVTYYLLDDGDFKQKTNSQEKYEYEI